MSHRNTPPPTRMLNRRRLLATGAAGAAGAALAALPLAAQQSGTLHEITIRKFKFIPNTLEVRVGDRIRWSNEDKAPHDAAARDGSWNTVILDHQKSDELVVTADMSPEYFCSVHPYMRATLTIVDA